MMTGLKQKSLRQKHNLCRRTSTLYFICERKEGLLPRQQWNVLGLQSLLWANRDTSSFQINWRRFSGSLVRVQAGEAAKWVGGESAESWLRLSKSPPTERTLHHLSQMSGVLLTEAKRGENRTESILDHHLLSYQPHPASTIFWAALMKD